MPAPSNPRSSSEPSQPPIRATEDRDLVAAVPYLIGYHPRRSLVLLGLAAGHLGPAARLDLDEVERDPQHTGLHLAGLLGAVGVTHCLIVVYAAAPNPSWLGALSDSLADHGVEPVTGWQVGERHFWPLADPTSTRPLRDLDSAPVAAQLVLAGLSPLPGRDSLAEELRPYPRRLRLRLTARAAALDPNDPAVRAEALLAWAGLLADPDVRPPRRGRSRNPVRPLPDRVTVVLLAVLAEPVLRDALHLAVLGPGTPRQQLRRALEGGATDGWSLAEAAGPDPRRVRAAVDVLGHLARAAVGPAAADPLAMLAHVHWWQGDGTRGNLAAGLALAADPEHSLARLVGRALEIGMPPPWRRRQAVSWPEGA